MFSVVNITICVCIYFFILLTNTHADVLQCYVCVDCEAVNETHIETCLQPDDTATQPSVTDETSTVVWTETQRPDQLETTTLPTVNPETEGPDAEVTVTSTGSSTGIPTTDIGDTTDALTSSTPVESTSITEPTVAITTDTYTPITEITETDSSDAETSNSDEDTNGDYKEDSILQNNDKYITQIPVGLLKYIKIEPLTTNKVDSNKGSLVPSESYNIVPMTKVPNFARPLQGLNIRMDSKLSDVPDTTSKENDLTFYKVEMVRNKNSGSSSRLRRALLEKLEVGNSASETRCVVTSFIEYNKTKVVRGCSFLPGNPEDRCRQLIRGGFTGNLTHCKVCEGDLCNSGYKSEITLVIFLLALFIKI